MKKQTKKVGNRTYVVHEGKVPGIYKDEKDANQQVSTAPNGKVKSFARCTQALKAFGIYCANRKTLLDIPLRTLKPKAKYGSEEDYFAEKYIVNTASYTINSLYRGNLWQNGQGFWSDLGSAIFTLQNYATCVIYLQNYSIYSANIIDPHLLRDPKVFTVLLRSEWSRKKLGIFFIAENYRNAKQPDCDRVLYLNLNLLVGSKTISHKKK